ncbi:MAG TPA: DUF5330 domain-containing protein [Xanthobacteraceae bacterium]|nr:DUF5330 domain-containing protein [Xanthobacteraceae bacterium]
MFFLLRMAFWLSIVLILLPTGSSQPQSANAVAATDAISAASATVGDLRQFCTRQPDACTVGSHVASELGYRAQAGAKMLYEFLTDRLAAKDAKDTKDTGSINSRFGKPAFDKSTMNQAAFNRASQNTLTSTDLAPAWRGPAPRKDGKRAI